MYNSPPADGGSRVRYCRFCRARGIDPVKIVSRHGPKVKTMYNCPICGEYLEVVWGKAKRSE